MSHCLQKSRKPFLNGVLVKKFHSVQGHSVYVDLSVAMGDMVEVLEWQSSQGTLCCSISSQLSSMNYSLIGIVDLSVAMVDMVVEAGGRCYHQII